MTLPFTVVLAWTFRPFFASLAFCLSIGALV